MLIDRYKINIEINSNLYLYNCILCVETIVKDVKATTYVFLINIMNNLVPSSSPKKKKEISLNYLIDNLSKKLLIS